MIRGYFLTRRGRTRPFVDAIVEFPALGRRLRLRLLVDTGADRTVLSPVDSRRLGINLAALPAAGVSTGVGGQVPIRVIEATLVLGAFSTPLALTVLESPPGPPAATAIPSLLGHDILSRFALFMEERSGRIMLLEPREVDSLNLP